MTKVQLKVNGEIQSVEVEEITVKQFKQGVKVVKAILAELKGNSKMSEFINFLSENEQLEADEKTKDINFGVKLAETFDYLLEEVPEHIVSLLAIASGVDENVVDNQPIEKLFDIFDAIVHENDIERLISRAKKSLAVTKAKWTIQKVVGIEKK